MAYLWENYTKQKDFRIAEKICPYIEVLNQNTYVMSVNPMIRFSRIFDSSFGEGDERKFALDSLTAGIGTEGTENIVNVLFHYLAQLDRTKGLDQIQRVIEDLRNEVEKGLWGKRIKSLTEEMTDADRECILYVLAQRVLRDNQSFFMEAVGKLFEVSSLCYEEKTKLFYLYIGTEKNDYNTKKLDLIVSLFWTLNRELKVVWNHHYGVVGCDDTMHIDNIQIV